MSSPAPSVASEHGQKLPCPNCNRVEARRLTAGLFARVLSIYKYRCANCRYGWRQFRFTLGFGLRVVTVLILLGGATYVALFADYSLWFQSAPKPDSATAALANARTAAGGQLSTFEQMMLRKPKGAMDNATILKLWRANVGTNVILQMIKNSAPDYDVSANAIIELRQANVDQTIILAMIDASYNVR